MGNCSQALSAVCLLRFILASVVFPAPNNSRLIRALGLQNSVGLGIANWPSVGVRYGSIPAFLSALSTSSAPYVAAQDALAIVRDKPRSVAARRAREGRRSTKKEMHHMAYPPLHDLGDFVLNLGKKEPRQ